jgi:hypothetical protein
LFFVVADRTNFKAADFTRFDDLPLLTVLRLTVARLPVVRFLAVVLRFNCAIVKKLRSLKNLRN